MHVSLTILTYLTSMNNVSSENWDGRLVRLLWESAIILHNLYYDIKQRNSNWRYTCAVWLHRHKSSTAVVEGCTWHMGADTWWYDVTRLFARCVMQSVLRTVFLVPVLRAPSFGLHPDSSINGNDKEVIHELLDALTDTWRHEQQILGGWVEHHGAMATTG